LDPGSYIKVSVHDTGIGIPREHLPRVFDPYFTTKENCSGLGLSTVFSIVKKHRGHITVNPCWERVDFHFLYSGGSRKQLSRRVG
ncbi:MAG: hybrid sensor histidine kinase/response regulator, partial [Chloroflexaceae bacterium]|nr:hybrid sensor histidine kinase/response regulator [Chloroflexaceae bacterium]